MKIVTSGRKYLDIDAYASMIAYRELLRALGRDAIAVSTPPLNQSVPKMMQDLSYKLDEMPESFAGSEIILLDVSNPEFFDTFVKLDDVVGVIDHHTGFEEYWKERLREKAEIEPIGAVCTMIFEKIEAAEKRGILTPDLCRLLAAGILDNTLNFQAETTDERDRRAWRKLMEIGGFGQSFADEYFEACYAEIRADLTGAIRDDTKIEKVSPMLPEVIGQIIVPKIEDFETATMKTVFAEYPEWMMNVIALKDGKSYIYFSDSPASAAKDKLEKLFKKSEAGRIVLDKVMLRKEIMKMAREYVSSASQ